MSTSSPTAKPVASAGVEPLRSHHGPGWHVVHLLGSMKLAVVLLVLLALLTWLGTLAPPASAM